MNKRLHKISTTETQRRRFACCLSAPAVLFSSLVIIYPLLSIIYLSFKNIKFFGAVNIPSGFTLANYERILGAGSFWDALGRTAVYTTVAVAFAFAIGMSLALMLNMKIRFQRVFRVLVLLAWPIPGVVVSILFMWMFDANFGIVNSILQSVGIISGNVPWLVNSATAFPAVIIATIWKGYPFFALMLLAGLQSVPEELYESAKIDGAGSFQRFRHITIPALGQVIAISVLQNGLWVFRNYDLISTMTGGGPNRATETLPMLLYNEAFKFSRMGSAAAVGVMGLLVCTIVVVLFIPALKKQFY